MTMKTFDLFCESKRSADLFWEVSQIMHEQRWEPVHFTIGMLEGWAEIETDSEKREILFETLRICDEEILLEANPFMDRLRQGYNRGSEGPQGGQLGNLAGRAVGGTLEKAGQLGGWLQRKWNDTKQGFMKGVGGDRWPQQQGQAQAQASGQASAQSGSGDDTIQFQQGQQGEVPPQDLVSVEQGAQYFDQLMDLMQRAGMDQQYLQSLKGLRDAWVNGGNNSAAARTASPATAPASSGDAMSDLTNSRSAGAAAAQGKPNVYQRHASLSGDVAKIQKELEQAQAAGDTQAVAQLQADLARYKRKASSAKGRMTRQAGKDVDADVAGYGFM